MLNSNIHGLSSLILFSDISCLQDLTEGSAGFVIIDINFKVICVGACPLGMQSALLIEIMALQFALSSAGHPIKGLIVFPLIVQI